MLAAGLAIAVPGNVTMVGHGEKCRYRMELCSNLGIVMAGGV